jgi:hypothetical protein
MHGGAAGYSPDQVVYEPALFSQFGLSRTYIAGQQPDRRAFALEMQETRWYLCPRAIYSFLRKIPKLNGFWACEPRDLARARRNAAQFMRGK